MTKKRQSESGFSLIEMSILLLILGALVIPAATIFNQYREKRAFIKTQEDMDRISTALAEYYAVNQRYPCPADPDLDSTSPTNGVAVGTPGNCNSGGVSVVPGYDYDGDGTEDDYSPLYPDNVAIGAVPFAELSIPLADTIDPYSNKITYAVSESMTNPGAADTWGAIHVEELSVDETTGSPEFEQYITLGQDLGGGIFDNDLDANGIPDKGLFHVIVISHGENKRGAYPKGAAGSPTVSCFPDLDDVGDDENCDGDASFLYSKRFGSDQSVTIVDPVAGPVTYNFLYDDTISFRVWSYGSLWSVAGGSDNIYNNNTGNVGIGTTDPQEKLHVSGNVKANEVKANWICDDVGNCFYPEKLGGDPDAGTGGMDCRSGGGAQVMVGISKGQELCAPLNITPLANQSCGLDGMGRQLFVVGIDSSGNIQCAPTP